MQGQDDEPELIYSKHCQDVVVDGHRFTISIISSDQDPEWCLEVIDERGTSHVWDATFENDDEALKAATIAFEDEGAAGFLNQQSNVIQFPTDR